MVKFFGKSACKGIALGPVVVLKNEDQKGKHKRADDMIQEIQKVDQGIQATKKQLQALCEKAEKAIGQAGAAIFEVHQMLLEDTDYVNAIYHLIKAEQVNAEYAVAVTGNNFSEMFARMDDAYMKARASDVKDISHRLIQNINGGNKANFGFQAPSIVVTDDLSPSQIMQMDKEKLLAFVMVHGSTHSHTSVLARMLHIPTLVGVPLELDKISSEMTATVDATQGEVIFEPNAFVYKEMKNKILKEQENLKLLQDQKGKDTVTLSGRKINVYANISGAGDVEYALKNDAEGIGLFRSEFLYLGRKDLPTESEQLQTYKQVLRAMGNKKVIIRTLDIGGDKQINSLHIKKEDNPALGYRAIRICLKQPAIFKTQLRALFRAAAYGNLSIMYPMIISAEEIESIFAIVEEVKAALSKEEIAFKIPEQGIMIETPAAVMISDKLAQMVDFFSIGTNDLTQYTLAIDRQNDKLDDFYNPHHEAILRMIQIVVENAHTNGKRVGICGELGADLALTEAFVKMGIDELSVSPAMLLPLRKRIRELS